MIRVALPLGLGTVVYHPEFRAWRTPRGGWIPVERIDDYSPQWPRAMRGTWVGED